MPGAGCRFTAILFGSPTRNEAASYVSMGKEEVDRRQ